LMICWARGSIWSKHKSQASGVRGRSWCLEEVWTQLFQNEFLSMNHQNPALGWSAFDQKRHSMLATGTPFSAWTLPSLSQPAGGSSLKLLLQTDDFIGFQNAFLSMNHQNPTAEWSAFDQKRHSMLTTGTPFSAWTQPSFPHPMQRESSTPWPSNWRISGFQKSFAPVSNQQSTWLEQAPFNQK
jgi:hypothetical protein